MIYTTGGMRVARVSVVDSTGKEIFDEFVRMDDGVEVMFVKFSLTLDINSPSVVVTSILASPE